jgi:hypothetical protein
MKQFYSHALMLLVQLADDGRSEYIRPSKIDTRTTDQHISRSDINA